MTPPQALRFVDGKLLDAHGGESSWPQLAVIGDPVEHSLSPRLHGAALASAGLADRYERIHVAGPELAGFVEAAGVAQMRGFNLTMPHKAGVLECGCRAAEEVRRIGAANTLVRRGGEWVAHNTDARGFALALQRWRGRELERTLREVLLIGAGGAARAVWFALEDLGARRVRVAARDPLSARWASELGATVETLGGIRIGDATLVVQCSSLGWHPDDPSPIAADDWNASTTAFELGYGGQPSRFLADARAAAVQTSDGLPMLVAQAALAFTMWYGGESPLAAMASSVGLDW